MPPLRRQRTYQTRITLSRRNRILDNRFIARRADVYTGIIQHLFVYNIISVYKHCAAMSSGDVVWHSCYVITLSSSSTTPPPPSTILGGIGNEFRVLLRIRPSDDPAMRSFNVVFLFIIIIIFFILLINNSNACGIIIPYRDQGFFGTCKFNFDGTWFDRREKNANLSSRSWTGT